MTYPIWNCSPWPAHFKREIQAPLYSCVVQNWGRRLLVRKTC